MQSIAIAAFFFFFFFFTAKAARSILEDRQTRVKINGRGCRPGRRRRGRGRVRRGGGSAFERVRELRLEGKHDLAGLIVLRASEGAAISKRTGIEIEMNLADVENTAIRLHWRGAGAPELLQ